MKKTIIVLLFMLTLVNISFAQWNDGKYYFKGKVIFEMADSQADKWYTDDKGFHLCGGWILNQHFDKEMQWWKSFFIVQVFSLVWEVKDGLISYKTVPFWGGDGFSYKDHLAVTCGQVGQLLFDHVFFKKSPMEKDKKIYRTKNLYTQL